MQHAEKTYIPAKDVAKIIRADLKRRFRYHYGPIGFTVRTDGNAVNVRWTDGPTTGMVREVIDRYAGGGFDGMIDMAYYCRHWQKPDGSLHYAGTSGTEGSMGSVSAEDFPAPCDGCRLVQLGSKYVFAQRDVSDAAMAVIRAEVVAKFGIVNPSDEGEWRDKCGDWNTTVVWREANRRILPPMADLPGLVIDENRATN